MLVMGDWMLPFDRLNILASRVTVWRLGMVDEGFNK
jgi:hypothetical protein